MAQRLNLIIRTENFNIMDTRDQKLRDEILKVLLNSRMTHKNKMKIMELMDKAFRKYMGIFICQMKRLKVRIFLTGQCKAKG